MVTNKKDEHWERTVPFNDAALRLDKFWGRELADEGVSRAKIKKWIEAGLALVDGEPITKGKHKLSGGETVSMGSGESAPGDDAPKPVEGDLPVLFEDDHLLVVVKPDGLTTHPAPSEPGPTLVNLLLHRWPDIAGSESGMDEQRPGIVHRLDKDTSGVMAVARTEAARLKLSRDFAERRVHKVYLAIVHGCPQPAEGMIEADIGRHPTQKTKMAVLEKGGREARSEYKTLWTGPRGLASLVAVRIHTGRTHQIRVHMAHIGHPLLGDMTYGSRENSEWERREDSLATMAPRQMLHAWYLSLKHPKTGEQVTMQQEPPKDFMRLLDGLNRECYRVGIVGMPGCGKSTLLSQLRKAGKPCFSADESVAKAYAAGGDGAALIRKRFGGEYSLEDGSVNKPLLFAAMKESDGVRREVMDLVHPLVRHECEMFFRTNRDAPVAYAEVPLLLEGGWHKNGTVDAVAGVRCPVEKRTGELRELRGLDKETLAVFDSWQWAETDKLAACDLIVSNDGGLDELEAGAEKLMTWAEERYAERNKTFGETLTSLWDQLAAEMEEEERE